MKATKALNVSAELHEKFKLAIGKERKLNIVIESLMEKYIEEHKK